MSGGSQLWFGLFCLVRGGFVCHCWFAFGVGFGRSARAAVSFVQMVGSRLTLVIVVPRSGGIVSFVP